VARSAQAARHGDPIDVSGAFSYRREQFLASSPADTNNAATDASAMGGAVAAEVRKVATLDEAVAAFNPTERNQRADDHPRSSVSDTRPSMHQRDK
jgi:hypothetical protein